MIEELENISLNDIPDIYFLKNYSQCCEITDKGQSFYLKNENIILPIIKKRNFAISNYGYGGIYFLKETNTELLLNYIINYLDKENINEYFIRFTPYFEVNCFNDIKPSKFEIGEYIIDYFKKADTFGIKLEGNYEDYLKTTKKNHRRSLRKAKDFIFEIRKPKNIETDFINIYNETMERVNATDYYYFDENYFKNLLSNLKENILIAEVKTGEEIVATAIIFKWKNNYLHYHLGCSRTEYLKYGINNFLHDGVIQYGFKNNYKLYHLGGGVKEDDSLEKFKEKMSNIKFDYYQCRISKKV